MGACVALCVAPRQRVRRQRPGAHGAHRRGPAHPEFPFGCAAGVGSVRGPLSSRRIRPPDDRGLQLDGSGWAVWALDQVASQLPSNDDRRQLVADLGGLLDRSVDAILVWTGNGTTLPPASADYWETPERRVTLATCSVLLTGLRSAERLYG